MFLYHKWLELSLATRNAIAEQFGIVKRGSTEVFNNTIKSDGYLVKEIEQALNIDAIQKFLGSDATDMQVLWAELVLKFENPDAFAANHPVEFKANTTPEEATGMSDPGEIKAVDVTEAPEAPKKTTRAKKTK